MITKIEKFYMFGQNNIIFKDYKRQKLWCFLPGNKLLDFFW